MSLKIRTGGMGRSTTKPGPEFGAVRTSIKSKGFRVTPFRLGLESGGLKNPYSAGSQAASLFRDGFDWAKRTRREDKRHG